MHLIAAHINRTMASNNDPGQLVVGLSIPQTQGKLHGSSYDCWSATLLVCHTAALCRRRITQSLNFKLIGVLFYRSSSFFIFLSENRRCTVVAVGKRGRLRLCDNLSSPQLSTPFRCDVVGIPLVAYIRGRNGGRFDSRH